VLKELGHDDATLNRLKRSGRCVNVFTLVEIKLKLAAMTDSLKQLKSKYRLQCGEGDPV